MAEIVCIARTGDPAPDGVGTFDEFFYHHSQHFPDEGTTAHDIFINSDGEIAFQAQLTGGTRLNDQGIFKGAIGSPLTQIARSGETLPDSVSTIESVNILGLNNQGQILFSSRVSYYDDTFDVMRHVSEVFRGIGGPLTKICPDAELMIELPSGGRQRPNYYSDYYVINSSDDVAISLDPENYTVPGFAGIHRCSDAYECVLIAEDGATAPGSTLTLYNLRIEDMNADGEVLFSVGFAEDLEYPKGLCIGAGGPLTMVAFQGQEAPDGSIIMEISDATLTTGGMAAFCAHRGDGFGSGIERANTVLRGSGGALIQIAGQGQAAPDGNGTFDYFKASRINASGQVVFWVSMEETRGGADDSRGIFLGTGSELIQIVREGQITPEGVGRFVLPRAPIYSDRYPLSIASGGQVAFWSELDEGGGQGIYLGNGTDLVKVVRSGDILDGREVLRVSFSARKAKSRQGLNDLGQVAFWANFTDGTEGVYLYTPDLHLYEMSDVPELLEADWPLDIPPGETHRVFVDPDKNIDVRIAEKSVEVKKLTIGGGKGSATVRLDGGNIRAVEGVEVAATGVLAGSGKIDGNVKNKGKVTPQKIVVDGDVDNKGKITGGSEEDQIQASGTMSNEGEIEGTLNVGCVFENQTSGCIRLQKGDTMRFHSTETSNRGRIAVNDATLDFTQNLNNATQGRIVARRANLRFNGGLMNSGKLSANHSRVHGSIMNRRTGTLSAHSKVVYDGDVNNIGCISTHFDSRSIFRGRLSGQGQWAGSGTVCIEGAFEPSTRGTIFSKSALVFGDNSKTKLVLHDEHTCTLVNVRSMLKLGGLLKVVVPKTINASQEDIFLLFQAKEIRGSFKEMILPEIDGLQFEVLCSRTRFSLLVVRRDEDPVET